MTVKMTQGVCPFLSNGEGQSQIQGSNIVINSFQAPRNTGVAILLTNFMFIYRHIVLIL